MKVRYSYLPQQFNDCEDLWEKLKKFVATGDFTLGKELDIFEKDFASLIGTKYAIGVNSGTDAIKLSLKALGLKQGDKIITSANTFVATVGAICEIGCIPVFVDVDDTFCIDTYCLQNLELEGVKAIVPVHFSGYVTKMDKILDFANKNNLIVVEDACQSILGEYNQKKAGTWGATGCFSLHPLKNINVWSDGGIITTDNKDLYNKIRLLRNHGISDRDHVDILGYNSRLDTFQSIVGSWLLPQANDIANKRIENANYLDGLLSNIENIRIPVRLKEIKIVYHLYMVFAKKRDQLLDYCLKNNIEAKIHYPVPMYNQKAVKHLNYKRGDFPVTDFHADNLISFPIDQHITKEELDYIYETVKKFYA